MPALDIKSSAIGSLRLCLPSFSRSFERTLLLPLPHAVCPLIAKTRVTTFPGAAGSRSLRLCCCSCALALAHPLLQTVHLSTPRRPFLCNKKRAPQTPPPPPFFRLAAQRPLAGGTCIRHVMYISSPLASAHTLFAYPSLFFPRTLCSVPPIAISTAPPMSSLSCPDRGAQPIPFACHHTSHPSTPHPSHHSRACALRCCLAGACARRPSVFLNAARSWRSSTTAALLATPRCFATVFLRPIPNPHRHRHHCNLASVKRPGAIGRRPLFSENECCATVAASRGSASTRCAPRAARRARRVFCVLRRRALTHIGHPFNGQNTQCTFTIGACAV